MTTSTYDSADRLVTTSGSNGTTWTYDPLGRITAMPTADGTAVATTAYYVNDLVAAQEVPGHERTTWTLDPLQRFSEQDTFAWVNGAWANSIESVNHYDGDSDEPAWIAEDITQPDKVSRYVEGADGNIAVQTAKTGGRALQLVDLHGDITATLPIPDGQTAVDNTALRRTAFDEFGVPQPMTSGATSNAPPARDGWLGAAQRSADTPTGTILMGVRLYAPSLGRFLQVDPVPGGSANAYDYCNADPINCTDLGGTFSWRGLVKAAAVVGEIASWIPGPIGAAAAGVSAVAYAASGNTGKAVEMAVTAAAQLVGAGAGVRAGFKVAAVAAKAGQKIKAAVKTARGCNSFAPGTLVLMADGSVRPIDHISEGDKVWSQDPVSGTEGGAVVIGPIRGEGTKHLVSLTFGDSTESVVATADHPFFVDEIGWRNAGDLRVGDIIATAAGEAAVRQIVDLGDVEDSIVFNLHVAGAHTYFVVDGEGIAVLVHNSPCVSGVYALVAEGSGKVLRTGRTSCLASRELQHARRFPKADVRFVTLYEVTGKGKEETYNIVRGLEAIVEAKRRPVLNRIQAISYSNGNRSLYLNAARDFLRGK